MTLTCEATQAFASFATTYDAYTAHDDYADWVRSMFGLGRRAATSTTGRLLDLGCGTGNSLLPLLGSGHELTGCDASRPMLAVARRKLGSGVTLAAHDITRLPVLGQFDVALGINDVVNYILTPAGLRAALACAATNLAPGGALVFDANTLGTFRSTFAASHDRRRGPLEFRWVATGTPDFRAGGVAQAVIEVYAHGPHGRRRVSRGIHRQRHHPHDEIVAALSAAGLELQHVHGQHPGGERDDFVDPARHPKAVYVATSSTSQAEGR